VTVILNEAAIAALFESPPIVAFVASTAEQKVVIPTQQAVADYFQSAPSLRVDQDVGFSMDGSTAVVGIRDAGSKSRRLARTGLLAKWLQAAVDGH
jgi:hypothetical protein